MKKDSNIIKLVKILNNEDSIRKVSRSIASNFPNIPKMAVERIIELLTSKENMENFWIEQSKCYEPHFTSKEIDGLVKFFSSRLGKKYRKLAVTMASDSLKLGERWGSDFVLKNAQKIFEILDEEHARNIEPQNTDISAAQQKKLEFALEYAQSRGWNPKELTPEQILEIRQQEGWKNQEGGQS